MHRCFKALTAGTNTRDHRPGYGGSLVHLNVDRLPAGPGTYAWLKIAEGCSHHCTYCAIPGIRGRLQSRPMPDIIREAKRLVESGFRELILVAQDTTRYGEDLYGKLALADLLRQLVAIPELVLLRIMYMYPDAVTDELIDVMASSDKIAHYVDLPIQHASDRILRRMGRRDTQQTYRELIHRLRVKLPDVLIRTTVMVGFPGETDDDIDELLHFLEDMCFERLGCFVYSPEEGTPAATYKDQVPNDVAEARAEQVMAVQAAIADQAAQERIGQVTPVVLEAIDEHGILYQGRSYGERPDVDPIVLVAQVSPMFRSENVIWLEYWKPTLMK